MYLSIKRKKKGNYYILGKFGGGQPQPIDYSKIPMYFKNVDNVPVTIGVKKSNASAYGANLQYSTDGETWSSWGSTSTTGLTKEISVGEKLYVRATENVGYFNNSYYYNYFTSSGKVDICGNTMSLGYKDFEGKASVTQNYGYYSVFYNMKKLINASDLVLPATTLGRSCYANMFYGCESLTTAPSILPATTLAWFCYNSMFYRCESLTTAPALPATTLANSCYMEMFYSCRSLTTAPALPATTLESQCYTRMFEGCTLLTTAPALPATTLEYNCYNGMFQNCISLTTAPELPATTLKSSCYQYMFNNCSKLNKVITYAEDISADYCLDSWLFGVYNKGDFYNLGTAIYKSGSSGIPTGWTEHKTLE